MAEESSAPSKRRTWTSKEEIPPQNRPRAPRSWSEHLNRPTTDREAAQRRDETFRNHLDVRATLASRRSTRTQRRAAPYSEVENADVPLSRPHGPEGESHRTRPQLEPDREAAKKEARGRPPA